MESFSALLAIGLLFSLAFANGANDAAKAIATLAGAGLASVRRAVAWGTMWTVAGAISGLLWGSAMIKNINGNVFAEVHAFSTPAALAIAAAPILWVTLATARKWPVSTTHAIVGGLIGTGLTAYGAQAIHWAAIFSNIALPLLVSPIVAIMLAWALTPALIRSLSVTGRIRICLTPVPRVALASAHASTLAAPEDCLVCACDSPQARVTPGFTVSVDHMHWLTSGLLSFSRGLNDTPKLIAVVFPMLLLGEQTAPIWLFVGAAAAMGLGSWIAGGAITEVLGFKVTKMNHEQGFAANLVAALLVIGASRFGLPVSTTHVASSSIMGVGLASNSVLNMTTIRSMLFAWLVTAPAAGIFAAAIYAVGLAF